MTKNTSSKASLLMAAASSGLIATGEAAVTYNETSGDLSNTGASPTILDSGTDTVIGTLNDQNDRNDFFIIGDLLPAGTAIFDLTFNKADNQQDISFSFNDPLDGASLFSTGFISSPANGSRTTPALSVPASGQIRISVQNRSTSEGAGPGMNWSVSTGDVVPEPSSAVLLALGALTMMRRQRKNSS